MWIASRQLNMYIELVMYNRNSIRSVDKSCAKNVGTNFDMNRTEIFSMQIDTREGKGKFYCEHKIKVCDPRYLDPQTLISRWLLLPSLFLTQVPCQMGDKDCSIFWTNFFLLDISIVP